MMTSLLPPKRYMATIALRAPGCSQPSRHRWHASHPSWVGLRTHTRGREGGRERKRERAREREREMRLAFTITGLCVRATLIEQPLSVLVEHVGSGAGTTDAIFTLDSSAAFHYIANTCIHTQFHSQAQIPDLRNAQRASRPVQ